MVMASGVTLGFLTIVLISMAYAPNFNFHTQDYWPRNWAAFAGIVLCGLIFLSGSLFALRDRLRAALIFLIGAPLVAFCLAFAGAGYLEWHSDGGGYFESPFISSALWLGVCFFIPFLVPLLIKRRGRAILLFFILSALVTPVFVFSRWTRSFLPELAGWTALFVAFGWFWLKIDRLQWPTLLTRGRRPTWRRAANALLISVVVFCLDVVIILGLSAIRSSLWSPDCGAKQPFTHALSTNHTVFTVKAVFVGRSLEWLLPNPNKPREIKNLPVGTWAIGVVQQRFWGLPPWWPRLVLLTDYVYWKDQTYFIDGHRASGLLTQALPIVEGEIECSRTKPIGDAIIDLRVLRESPHATGARLIGYVREPQEFLSIFSAPPVPPHLSAGAQITVSGPMGVRTAKTDASGVYEFDDLPPGDYALRLLPPEGQVTDEFSQVEQGKVHLTSGALLEHDFNEYWDGRISGHVNDENGKPAHVWYRCSGRTETECPVMFRVFCRRKTTALIR